MNACPNCGHFLPVVPLPVEPLFNREEVCALIPIKYDSLRALVRRNKHLLSPPKYVGQVRRGKRMYTPSDVRTLRALFVRNRQ